MSSYPDRGPVTSAVTIVMMVLATVFVAARFYTRLWIVRSVKQDDWWILGAWVLALGFSISICVAVKYGLGLHRANIPLANFPSLRKAEYSFSVLYNPALMLTKTSIVVFYLSVMSKDVDPVFKWCNWLTLALANGGGLALTFFIIFQCSPIKSTFIYPTPPNEKCIDIVTLYLSSAPINIITDLAILFLPMPILTGMRLPKKQKIILVVTFSFGAFVAIVDVIRIAFLQDASIARLQAVKNNTGSTQQSDFPWYASLSFMWSAVEVNLGIICACVPSLKPLFMRFLPNFIRDSSDGSVNGSVDQGTPQLSNVPNFAPIKGNASMVNNPAAFRRPAVKEYSGEDDGDEMGFLNMLAGPDDDAPNAGRFLTRTTTNLSSVSTRKSATSDFGFVTMDNRRNMLKLTNTQSIWPIGVVTVIFFMWGVAYGLLDTLNSKFQQVVGLKGSQPLGLHAAYFGGYLIGPLTLGQFILKKYGFKAAMMTGLCVYGCGTLVFWPSAVLTSYTAFVISNFIVGVGLSCLEIAANPYIALCGPLEYAEARLNFSQGFQAIGSILSPLLATKVLFRQVGKSTSATSLVNVQWTYLGIALFVIALAVAFYYIPLPEASDEQLQAMADNRTAVYSANVGPIRVIWVTLALGVFSQFCYVGGQEAIGNDTQSLYKLIRPTAKLTPFDFQTVCHTVFMAGRFLSAFLNYVLKPRWILLALYTGLIICCGLQMVLGGTAALVVNQLIYLFESGTFSIIFAISLRGMGEHTKTAAALMTSAISGGALFPPFGYISQQHHPFRFSFVVPLIAYAFGWLFPVYLNLVPAAKAQVQPTHENRNMRRANRRMRRQSEMSNGTSRQFGLAGIIARRKKAKALNEMGTSQHIEQRQQSEGTIDFKSPTTPMTPSSEFDKMDFSSPFPEEPQPVQLRRPSGVVGDLQDWPGTSSHNANGDSEKNGTGSEDSDVITRHRPAWDEKDDDEEDDYHMFLRGR